MMFSPFYLQKENVFAVPILHSSLESAKCVLHAIEALQPDAIAVELPESLEQAFFKAAERLPDMTVIESDLCEGERHFYLSAPLEPLFEGLRRAKERGALPYCIDSDATYYESIDHLPDPFAIDKIGLKAYFAAYQKYRDSSRNAKDLAREEHMAKRLKELSLRHERVLFVSGMAHIESVLNKLSQNAFSIVPIAPRDFTLFSPTTDALREILEAPGALQAAYEKERALFIDGTIQEIKLDRSRHFISMLHEVKKTVKHEWNERVLPKEIKTLLDYLHRWSHIEARLLPSLYQQITGAKSCIGTHFAYELWKLATDYPLQNNIDNLPEKAYSPEMLYQGSKKVFFRFKLPSRKGFCEFEAYRNKSSSKKLKPPSPFTLCSYPKEDLVIESFGRFLKKKGEETLRDATLTSIPFSSSLEDGIDAKETLRHFAEGTLWVKKESRTNSHIGSIVIIFDEDEKENQYPWTLTWIGEHMGESDMAFYSTEPAKKCVGPGIFQCEYGGLFLSYPPRRLLDVFSDMDYQGCQNKAEILLSAAIDYSREDTILYAAKKPPRQALKRFAKRFGKKILYFPLSEISKERQKKIQRFHILEGHDKREIAGEYIL